LESGELRLTYDDAEANDEDNYFPVALHYYDRRFPISPRSYRFVLSLGLPALDEKLTPDHPEAREYRAILEAAHALPDRSDPDAAARARRHEEKESLKRRLTALTRSGPAARAAVDAALATLAGRPGDARSFDALDDLLARQCFRLAYWRVAPDEINYRRFFDINDLAGLAVEHEDVFEATHALPLRLLAQGHLTGLRIDHPDGLHDPAQYFRRLQTHYVLACAKHLVDTDPQFEQFDWDKVKRQLVDRLSSGTGILPATSGVAGGPTANATARGSQFPLYVTIEKILAPSEPLIPDWPVHGTSGYDFLNVVNALFVDPAGEESLTRTYEWFLRGADPSRAALRAAPVPSAPACSRLTDFHALTYEKKKLILDTALSSELHTLAARLHDLAGRGRGSRDLTLRGLRGALTELVACFPVYRTYVSAEGVSETDRAHVKSAVDEAIRRNPHVEPAVFQFIARTVLQDLPEGVGAEDRAAALKFAAKFQQLTAPATAKGIEDTAFYLYNRLLSLNEVGNEPTRFGMSPADVHAYMADRAKRWPYALSCLSTHDTKRSEDVRARLNVISELPDEWAAHVGRWRALNARHKTEVQGAPAPDANDEYLIYQSLLGAWPAESSGQGSFESRIHAYLTKALREAKLHTTWTRQNEPYEAATLDFASQLLADPGFLDAFLPFERRVAQVGHLNSLAQTALRLTAPGVPDTYQGTELPDLSLVDPDNRRPVDYPTRRLLLENLFRRDPKGELQATPQASATPPERVSPPDRASPAAKLFLTATLVRLRRDNPGLFSAGDYIPLTPAGPRAEHCFAFARHRAGKHAVVLIPRLIAASSLDALREFWQGTSVPLPAPLKLRNVLTGARIDARRTIDLAEAFADFPVAVFIED
ncbi:MAG TPA: malto-oligosyltrehalose synthase, partial [Tepidisphaeraceae bacterium]|nr:malto-oligosyltrehalose synthase [Tepidisphaeraceae bacterium]